jgi:hypothetical protein
MQKYARQAKNGHRIAWATNIRFRAARKAGQLLKEMAEKDERDRGHGDRKSGLQDAPPKLSDLGVIKNAILPLAKAWRDG